MALLDQSLCSFSSTALPLEPIVVAEWRGEEALSRPYRFELKLATINPLFDDEAMLGQAATLKLTDAKGRTQFYHGVVSEAELLDGDGVYYFFRVVLEPRMTQLRQFRFSEIWLDKTLPDIIRSVLGEIGLSNEGPGVNGDTSDSSDYDFDIRLAQDDLALQESSFTCQFEETSLAFLSRLLEYFGVYYFFEQQGEHEALVFCGDQRYQPQAEMLLNYRPLDTALDAGHGIALTRTFQRKLASQPKSVLLQDFSATNAQLELMDGASIASASMPANADSEQRDSAADTPGFSGEQWLYGEHFGSNQQGQSLANLRAQELGCRHRQFNGHGRAVGLRAGFPMRLLGHPRLTLNTNYLVISVQHDGSQPLPGLGQDVQGLVGDINTRFVALPGDVQFRPLRITRKPRVQGLLSAVVDGDDTGQPLLNKNGCYKVIFPFIRSDKPETRGSAWLRMATMSSGANHGMHFPLLKGTEVLVSFLGGDPDRPVITGSVPNSENPNMVNEKNATQSGLSTPGGHFMAMEDDPAGRRMKLGAPEGLTLLTMGNGRYSGADLSTGNHMNLASNSAQQQVGTQYKSIHGSVEGPADSSTTEYKSPAKQLDEAIEKAKKEAEEAQEKYKAAKEKNASEPSEANKAAEEKAKEHYEAAEKEAEELKEKKKEEEERQTQISALLPTAEPIDTKWGNSSKWNWGAKMGWKNARTFSAELSTSVFSYECNAGLTKNDMNLYASTNAVDASLFKAEWKLGLCEYEYSNAHKKTTPIDSVKAGNSKLEAVSRTVEVAAVSKTSAAFIDTEAASAITLSVAGHQIEISPGGIRISSALPLIINTDVIIAGCLTVEDTIVSDSMMPVSLSVETELKAPIIQCQTFSATSSTVPEPFIPQAPVFWGMPLANIAASNTAYEAEITALVVARTAAEALAETANEAFEAEEAAEQVKGKVALGVLATSVAAGIAGFAAGAATAKKDAE